MQTGQIQQPTSSVPSLQTSASPNPNRNLNLNPHNPPPHSRFLPQSTDPPPPGRPQQPSASAGPSQVYRQTYELPRNGGSNHYLPTPRAHQGGSYPPAGTVQRQSLHPAPPSSQHVVRHEEQFPPQHRPPHPRSHHPSSEYYLHTSVSQVPRHIPFQPPQAPLPPSLPNPPPSRTERLLPEPTPTFQPSEVSEMDSVVIQMLSNIQKEQAHLKERLASPQHAHELSLLRRQFRTEIIPSFQSLET